MNFLKAKTGVSLSTPPSAGAKAKAVTARPWHACGAAPGPAV